MRLVSVVAALFFLSGCGGVFHVEEKPRFCKDGHKDFPCPRPAYQAHPSIIIGPPPMYIPPPPPPRYY